MSERISLQSPEGRGFWISGRGFGLGWPMHPSADSNATTGVPTDGIAGFYPGALFLNTKAAASSTCLYVNVGTVASAVWRNLDANAALAATASQVANAVKGVAAGYAIARGTTALDGSNPTPVTTGLTTVTGATISLEGSTAPGSSTSLITQAQTNWATGALSVYAWGPTGAALTALQASTGTENFQWIAVGTI